MVLTEEEREELRQLSRSAPLREDMIRLRANRHNPFIVKGEVDIDRWITFLTEYNEFINHVSKPFSPIVEKVMKL